MIRLTSSQTLRTAHHFGHRAKPELGHQLAYFLRNKPHKVDEVCWIAGEPGAQFRILRRHADGTGVQMTSAHHNAAERYEWRSRKTKLFRAEQCGYDTITTGFQLPVRLDRDAAA